jgi:exonuclease SbcC
MRIIGFLSYQEPTEIDFTSIQLACISGRNGAGKSALLDAFTWSLFGQARKRDESIINSSSDYAEVTLTFEYEGNEYRVQRTMARGKGSQLEFVTRICQTEHPDQKDPQNENRIDTGWKSLTERTSRETQARIEEILRLDYDTFVNASFFIQGKADQFTQQSAGKRKSILSNVLGLEIWESYQSRAADRRRILEREVGEIEGRIAEIETELSEEEQRVQRVTELDSMLLNISAVRTAQENNLNNLQKAAITSNELGKTRDAFVRVLEGSRASYNLIEDKIKNRELERAKFLSLLEKANEITAAHKDWLTTRTRLQDLDGISVRFLEVDKKRSPLLEVISAERIRLEEEIRHLTIEKSGIEEKISRLATIETELVSVERTLTAAENAKNDRREFELSQNVFKERLAELRTENEQLNNEMKELKVRMDNLRAAGGAECPLCGQLLTEQHRSETLGKLENQGKNKGDRYRANLADTKMFNEQVSEMETRITSLKSADQDFVKLSNRITQLNEQKQAIESQVINWHASDSKKLEELETILNTGNYALEARQKLAVLETSLGKLGYDFKAHEGLRRSELEKRTVEEQYAALQTAEAVNRRLEQELVDLDVELAVQKQTLISHETDLERVSATIREVDKNIPDIYRAEKDLLQLREDENQTRDELGAARQKVDILVSLRARKREYSLRKETQQKQISKLKNLERAFGKDGVPALLIEQALPQIETKANELLDRLSAGQMNVRFLTQAGYKDKKREGLKETLDIQIIDSSGERGYEMFSGGEAFRINFAIRLALSEMLTRRKGARLQTLVIDEGFGSQDDQGRQRLIESINLVRKDFAKIFVITHIDELKDAFPSRIEVEKTDHGSTVVVH